jgi:hypothetical protein
MTFMQEDTRGGLAKTQPVPFPELKHPATGFGSIRLRDGALSIRCQDGGPLDKCRQIIVQYQAARPGLRQESSIDFGFQVQCNCLGGPSRPFSLRRNKADRAN